MLNFSPISIDFGSSSIKIAEISGKENQKKAKSLSIEPLPEGLIQNGTIEDAEKVQEILESSLKKNKILKLRRRTTISLASSILMYRRIVVPRGDEENLWQTAFYEAEQNFDYDINDMYVDYVNLESQDTETMSIGIVGAPKESASVYLDIIKKVGLRVGVVEVDSFALINMFKYNYDCPSGLALLVNIGAGSSQLIFVGDGEFLYTRNIPIGGNYYTSKISSDLDLSYEEAELLKINISNGTSEVSENILNITNELNEQLASEIRTTIDYFFQNENTNNSYEAVENYFLSGGGASAYGLEDSLKSSTTKNVEILDPFKNITLSGKTKNLEISQKNCFSIVSGLGLRQLEFK